MLKSALNWWIRNFIIIAETKQKHIGATTTTSCGRQYLSNSEKIIDICYNLQYQKFSKILKILTRDRNYNSYVCYDILFTLDSKGGSNVKKEGNQSVFRYFDKKSDAVSKVTFPSFTAQSLLPVLDATEAFYGVKK